MSKTIICGVGPGMGCSISKLLKNSNHEISIISRNNSGEALAQDLGVPFVKCDLNNYNEVSHAFEKLISEMGGLDAVVHLAGGFYSDKKIDEVDEDLYISALSNNARTFYNVARIAVSKFGSDGGSIVVISAAKNVYMNSHVGYAAGKGAVDYMVKRLSKELAERNVRVNAVSPGFISRVDCGKSLADEKLITPGRHDSRFVAEAVKLLLNNRLITGQIIELDSGFSALLPKGL